MKFPRILHRIYTFILGYFWLPCPLCGRYFGGHEVQASILNDPYDGCGRGVCPNCTEIARARNKAIF